MAFKNDAEFEDDFRKVGPDATAGLEPTGTVSNPTEHASSENVEVAGAEDEDDDLEDDEDVDADEEEDEDEDDLEDDDEEDEEDEEDGEVDADEDDEEDDDEDEYDDEDDDEDEDEEDSDGAVMARLKDAEKTARAKQGLAVDLLS